MDPAGTTSLVSPGELMQAGETCLTTQKLIQAINRGQLGKEDDLPQFKATFHNMTHTGRGVVVRDSRLFIPPSIQRKVVQRAHEQSHASRFTLLRYLRPLIFFPKMEEVVEEVVKACSACHQMIQEKAKVPIVPHLVPEKVHREKAEVSVSTYRGLSTLSSDGIFALIFEFFLGNSRK